MGGELWSLFLKITFEDYVCCMFSNFLNNLKRIAGAGAMAQW